MTKRDEDIEQDFASDCLFSRVAAKNDRKKERCCYEVSTANLHKHTHWMAKGY